MGVRLQVEGLLLAAEHRADDDGKGDGFYNATVLPEGSRETLDLWAFGDSAAAAHLVERFTDEGAACAVLVTVETRAKLNKAGNAANLSTQVIAAVSPDGEMVEGRVVAPSESLSQ